MDDMFIKVSPKTITSSEKKLISNCGTLSLPVEKGNVSLFEHEVETNFLSKEGFLDQILYSLLKHLLQPLHIYDANMCQKFISHAFGKIAFFSKKSYLGEHQETKPDYHSTPLI